MANLYDTPYFRDRNIGIGSLLSPQNVERGVNLLQGNQGIVNALTGLPIGPASGRAYIRNLSLSEEPISEDFFNADQLAEIKNRTASSMAEASMDPSSFNALNKVVSYDLENPISMSRIFSDPVSDIDATLGKYTYRENPDGTISAIDTHDFDSIAGGRKQFYGQEVSGVGRPEYRGTRDLPFLEPWEIPADPGFFIGKMTDESGFEEVSPYGPANIYDPYPTSRFVPGDDAYRLTQNEDIYQPKGGVLSDVINAYHNKQITGSKLARIIGGMYGHSGTDLSPDEESMHSETGDYLMRNQPNWTRSGIPVNINLGIVSHLDKLRANRNFARYIANTKTIPSQIRKQAQKIAPKRVAPIHAPSQYREPTPSGNGGGSQRTFSRTSPGGISQATSRAARSGMSGWRLSQGGFI